MSSDILLELYSGFYQWFRLLVPEPKDRIPITPVFALYWPLFHLPFSFLAFLSRRPDTYLIRLLLLPTVLTCSVAVAYRYTWTIPSLNVYNWGQTLAAAVQIAKALEYALTPEGMLKKDEIQPGVPAKYTNGNASNGHANGHAPAHTKTQAFSSGWPAWLTDTVSVAHTLRGFSYKFSSGLHIPSHTRPLTPRSAFIKSTFYSFLKNYLLLDLLESLLKLFPGVGDVTGGSMFYTSLPLVQRYLVSTGIHLLTGSALLAGFGMVYDLCTFVAIAFFSSDPTSWPPVLEDPWSSPSMHELWSKRWHQLLRRTFLVFGGIPSYHLTRLFVSFLPSKSARKLLPQLAAVFGTFLASGLFHEVAVYSMFSPTNGYTFSWAPIIFFTAQAPVLVLERLVSSLSPSVTALLTGERRKVRVGGRLGRAWVWFWMFGPVAQMMTNSWHERGLGGGMIIPPWLSPAKWILPRVLPQIVGVVGMLSVVAHAGGSGVVHEAESVGKWVGEF
ncbi:hypothetical protein K435DRAFT_431684 [Dendrothele bispora CBS 962.96]|uniref:Wax synthase domain-containing protein n=1 Tax=Dendrothele bispora (strain CBS 962.96) TaxID=1314807 RepID=A0A4S8ME80_DENBC|nr:hypothetical protein K435DRAFT_431684 [Dendrothele bispora CBS 962.96]